MTLQTDLVRWREWSRETLLEAEQRDTPVFLVIEQFWCAASRLLHRDCWTDPDIASTLEQDYVPVLVDAARHPDIDRRFRMGGWPALTFLTPQALPITTTGYTAPDVLTTLLENVSELYAKDREAIVSRVSGIEQAKEEMGQLRSDPSRPPNPWMTLQVIDILKNAADTDFGGFGTAPRFPHFDALELLLEVHKRTADKELLKLATDALDPMMQGGLYDWESGGFYRCSQEQDWSEPRQEKLLEDQARHISIYTLAHQMTGSLDYREAAIGCIDYCLSRLRNPAEGWFAASELTGDSFIDDLEYEVPDGAQTVDRTLIAPGNARMSRALLQAGTVFGDDNLKGMGARLANVLQERLAPAEGWAYHFHDGSSAQRPGLLADQSEIGLTMLEAFEHTHDESYLQKAEDLASKIADTLYDPRQPGFYDADDPMDLHRLALRDKAYDDNMALARFAARLFSHTNDPTHRAMSERALAGFTRVWEQVGPSAASFGLGLLDLFADQDPTDAGPQA